jgi:hypothetical protein
LCCAGIAIAISVPKRAFGGDGSDISSGDARVVLVEITEANDAGFGHCIMSWKFGSKKFEVRGGS